MNILFVFHYFLPKYYDSDLESPDIQKLSKLIHQNKRGQLYHEKKIYLIKWSRWKENRNL